MKEIDVSKSELVPKHRVLSEKEKEELLKKYRVTLKQLPRILSSDPMVKLLNAKIGDIIEIERKSPLGGKVKYYRVVVKG
ncbi:MAG: DNA-directed RNA polymerase subunit H [Candidatus Aenigmarchaeota archaeon ex4484_224]|nr:MAG: DNA-directed RNA polymerase subunit H [Candidatus Aenigmarchaeota archaeon ex4484_224]